MKLWGRATSSNVMKVIWLLEELGLAYERVDVGGPFGGTASPEYRAMNPLGVVPSFEEAGFTLNRPQSVVFQGLIRTAPEHRDHAAIAAAVGEAGRIWTIVDGRLAEHPHVAGEAFSLADIAFGVHVHRWFNMAIDRPSTPHLHAWYERLLERPAYRRHCAGPVV